MYFSDKAPESSLGDAGMTNFGRVSAAVIFSPLAVIPAHFIIQAILNVVDIFKLVQQGFFAVLIDRYLTFGDLGGNFGLLVLGIVYIFTLSIGLPVHFVFANKQISGLTPYAAAGAFGGLIAGFLFLTPKEAVYTALLGAVVALVFQAIAGTATASRLAEVPTP